MGRENRRLWLLDVRFVQRRHDGRPVERLDLDGVGDRHRVVAVTVWRVLDRREHRVDAGEQRRPTHADAFQYVTSGECIFDWHVPTYHGLNK